MLRGAMMRALALAACGTIMLAGQSPPTSGAVFASTANGQPTPFDMIGDRILVKVRVNGSPPLPFVLDTGASANVIGLAHAWATGLALQPLTTRTVGIGADQPELFLATDTMTFGLPGVDVSDGSAIVMALDKIQECFAGAYAGRSVPAIDGILGKGFFATLVVKIDYAARILSVYEPRSFSYRGKGQILPIEIDSTYTYVRARLAASGRTATAKLVVDTGAGALSVTRQFAEAHGLLPQAGSLTPGAECGSGGMSSDGTAIGRIAKLQLGGLTLSNPTTAFYRAGRSSPATIS